MDLESIWSQYGANHFANMFILPLNSSQRILSGNFDNDTREEVLNINNTWSATADYSSGNFVQNWNNGGTSLINDWALNTNSNEYLTVKANPHNQKHILGMKSNSFNSLITASMYRGNKVQNKSAIANSATSDEKNKLEIMLYPNPNKGIFNLLVKNQTDFQAESQIKVTDISGRQVYSQIFSNPNIEIDLSSNPKGVYLIEIKTNGQSLNTKFIIE